LTDKDAIAFLQRCRAHLNPNGLIFVKDNVAGHGLDAKKEEALFVGQGAGICRVYGHYVELFEAAGLTIVEAAKQKGLSDGLLPVFCFMLQSTRFSQSSTFQDNGSSSPVRGWC
jgi:protein N-terminal methyltransferase